MASTNFTIRGAVIEPDGDRFEGRVSHTSQTLKVMASSGGFIYNEPTTASESTGRRVWTVTLADGTTVTVEGKGCGCNK